MDFLIDVIENALEQMKKKNKILIEEIEIYKDILYSIDFNDFELNKIKERFQEIKNIDSFESLGGTTPIKTFLANLIKDKEH